MHGNGKLKIANRKSQTCPERSRRVANHSAGLTLTEVVIASALLIVAIVPILKALTAAQATTAIIERRTRSLTLAQGKLDDIRARSVYDWFGNFAEADTSLDGSYLCDVQDDSQGPILRTITVSVGYDLDGNSSLTAGEIEVTLVTLVAKRWTIF